ncbi:MAG: FAD-dependent oxidoreductase [Microcystis aeruginosa]
MDLVKRLVFIGGGHSHAIALRLWGQSPLKNVQLTLISDVTHTPYSGMLPGHIAGFYDFAETHIDLPSLARYSQAQFCLAKANFIDTEKCQVICNNSLQIPFDYLSIDIGSIPAVDNVIGAKEYAIPAKPVPIFREGWQEILKKAVSNPNNPLNIVIVGGGAGGVELALNMQSRLAKILNSSSNLNLSLIHRGKKLLPAHNNWVGQRLENIFKQRGIRLYLSTDVTAVQADQIICSSGLVLPMDYTIWVTTASAPSWIKASGLLTDEKGFILVNNYLQSLSHPHIFAVGDIATIPDYPRPKAGVFAVRQGKPLFDNLARILQNRPLKPYFPQKNYLSLIGTGDQKAIASWGGFGWQSPLLWSWKDRIDRAFMRQFDKL